MSAFTPHAVTPESPTPTPSQASDPRHLLHALLDRGWIVLGVFLVAAMLTFAHVQCSPRIYAATATLQVEQQEQKILKFDRVVQEDLRSLETIRTIVQTLKTRSLLERVATTNKLADDSRFFPNGPSSRTPTEMAGMLAPMVSVRLRTGTRLIDVTVEHTNPALVAQLANSLVQEFVRLGFEQDWSASELASEHLQRETERLKTKLHDSETALQDYMANARLVSLEERQNIVVPKLKELSTKVTEAKSARLTQEADYVTLKQLGTNVPALLTLSAIANDPGVLGIQLSIARLESEFAILKQRYRAEHPKYIQAETQLADLRNSLSEAVLRAQQFIATAFESSKAAEKSLEAALQEQEQAALELNKQGIQYSVLAREVEADRAMYNAVLNRLKETSLSKDLASYKVRIVEPALEPSYPVKPEKTKLLIRGLILGLLAGIGLALGINALDNSFKTVDQVEEVLGAPVIATIPIIRSTVNTKSQIVVDANPNSADAEAFRNLRAAVSMLGHVEDRRVFLFTSALPQEGKTFCSLNFAITLAQQGLRTLLIDCDLRRPSVERAIFGERQAQFGLTDFLTGHKPFSDLVNETPYHHFSFIGVGSYAPNPSELLAQGRFAKLLEEAIEQFDRIVIDSAPIQAVSDTLLILERVQTVCLTVRAGRTPRKAALRALQTLKSTGAPVAGIVLNCLKRRRGGGYYYNYYDYSYHDEGGRKANAGHRVAKRAGVGARG